MNGLLGKKEKEEEEEEERKKGTFAGLVLFVKTNVLDRFEENNRSSKSIKIHC